MQNALVKYWDSPIICVYNHEQVCCMLLNTCSQRLKQIRYKTLLRQLCLLQNNMANNVQTYTMPI